VVLSSPPVGVIVSMYGELEGAEPSLIVLEPVPAFPQAVAVPGELTAEIASRSEQRPLGESTSDFVATVKVAAVAGVAAAATTATLSNARVLRTDIPTRTAPMCRRYRTARAASNAVIAGTRLAP
jgi:hypothetical protein